MLATHLKTGAASGLLPVRRTAVPIITSLQALQAGSMAFSLTVGVPVPHTHAQPGHIALQPLANGPFPLGFNACCDPREEYAQGCAGDEERSTHGFQYGVARRHHQR